MLNDTMQRIHILLISPWGIPVPTNVPHQRRYCFNCISLCRTVPSQFIATYLKGIPQIQVRIYSNSQTKTFKSKAIKSNNRRKYDELILRYTPLINSPAESPVLWYGGQNRTVWNAGLHFAFVFTKCYGKKESPPTFILSNWKGKKHRKIPFSRFWVRGLDYRKGRY